MNLSQYLRHLYDVLPTYAMSEQTPVFFSDLKPGDCLFYSVDFSWDVVIEVNTDSPTRLITRRLVPGRSRRAANRKIYLGRPRAAVNQYGGAYRFYKARDVVADISYFTEPVIRLLTDCEEGTCFRLLGDEFITKPQVLLSKQGRGLSVRVPNTVPPTFPRPILDEHGVMEVLSVEVLDINDFVS